MIWNINVFNSQIQKRIKGNSALRGLGIIVQISVGLVLLLWLVRSNDIQFSEFLQRITQASIIPLILGIACFASVMALAALRYSLFLPAYIPNRYLFSLSLFQTAWLTFLPWRLGEISYPLMLQRDFGHSIKRSATSIFVIRMFDLLILFAVALIGSERYNLLFDPPNFLGGSVLIICCVVVLGALVWRPKIRSLYGTIRRVATGFLRDAQLAKLIIYSLAIFALSSLQSMFVLKAVALDIRLLDIAYLNAFTLLSALIPVHPPGGWGTIDSIQILLLGRLGYSPAVIVTPILAAHAFYSVLILAGGMSGWLLRMRSLTSVSTD